MCTASAASRQAAVSSVLTPSEWDASGWRMHASAALRRLLAAIRFVKTLSRTTAVYSSGPVTPSRCQTPWRSWCPRESQRRAVSTSTSSPHSCSREWSPVTVRYRSNAIAMSALTCHAAVPAGQYAEHSCPRIVRHGKLAPARSSWAARSFASERVEARHRRASAAACGTV